MKKVLVPLVIYLFYAVNAFAAPINLITDFTESNHTFLGGFRYVELISDHDNATKAISNLLGYNKNSTSDILNYPESKDELEAKLKKLSNRPDKSNGEKLAIRIIEIRLAKIAHFELDIKILGREKALQKALQKDQRAPRINSNQAEFSISDEASRFSAKNENIKIKSTNSEGISKLENIVGGVFGGLIISILISRLIFWISPTMKNTTMSICLTHVFMYLVFSLIYSLGAANGSEARFIPYASIIHALTNVVVAFGNIYALKPKAFTNIQQRTIWDRLFIITYGICLTVLCVIPFFEGPPAALLVTSILIPFIAIISYIFRGRII